MDIIAESSGTWSQQKRRFVERQLDTVIKKGGIVINNNEPFDEIAIAKATGLELDERINKAIEVCEEDWEENMEEERIDPLVFLDYVAHARILDTPLYHCIQEVMEAIKREDIKKEGNKRSDVEVFLESLPYYNKMSIFEKALLDYVLVEAGLIPRALPALKPTWGWERRGGEYSKISTRIEEALKDLCEGIPYPVLATVYYKEKEIWESRKGQPIIESWGFKSFVERLLTQGETAIEASENVAKIYPYIVNAIYSEEKIRHYVKLPNKPTLLVIGCGDLSWVFPFARAIDFGQLDGVDIKPLGEKAELEAKKWGLFEEYIAGKINWIQGDATSLEDVKELEGKKYDLILLRTPFQYLRDLQDALSSALKYLKDNGIIILYTHKGELKSGYKVPEAILEAGEELDLLQFDIYTLNPRLPLLPYTTGDKMTILTRKEAKKLLEYLKDANPSLTSVGK
jgi:SAM-dependent methyltransferase